MRIQRYAPIIASVVALALLISSTTLVATEHAQAKVHRNDDGFTLSQCPLLSKYAVDLTDLASQNRLERSPGHEADVAQVTAQLSDTSKAPVLVGAFALDRTAVASELAFSLRAATAPIALSTKHIISLNIDALAKDSKTAGEFER